MANLTPKEFQQHKMVWNTKQGYKMLLRQQAALPSSKLPYQPGQVKCIGVEKAPWLRMHAPGTRWPRTAVSR